MQNPLILNVTNYVAMNFSANALLAMGASPLMSSEPLEMKELTSLCSALVINIGCLESRQAEAMLIAAKEAEALGKPWVLDPAGVGASRFRAETVHKLICCHPTIIRGNASEILFLAGMESSAKGVDTGEDSSEAVEAGKKLAMETGAVVSISGPTDFVTDGNEVICITGGSPLAPRVTAMGCVASAVTAAFAAGNGNAMNAAADAMRLMKKAAEAAEGTSNGPGTFAANFIDALSK